VPSPRLCAKAHILKVATVANRWQHVGDLIGSGFEPHTSRTRSERLITCAIWPVMVVNLYTDYSVRLVIVGRPGFDLLIESALIY